MVQDLVVPDLKAVRARLDALEKRMEVLDARFDRFEQRFEQRFNEVMSGIQSLIRFNNLESRLAELEKTRHPGQGQLGQ
ncbi:MAG TPA: hypothetical protein VGJ21_03260 [Terracidiphilus sp.]